VATAQGVILTKIDTATVREVALSLVVCVRQRAACCGLTIEVLVHGVTRIDLLECNQVWL
jgi:hypothetical protein